MSTTTEWVHWFVDGHAKSYPATSPMGEKIAVWLAAAAGKVTFCSAPIDGAKGVCGQPVTGRGDKRYCSPACQKRARRAEPPESPDRARRPRSRPVGAADSRNPDSADIAPRESPGRGPAATTDIADTASAERVCEQCGRRLVAKRAKARFCGDSCRKAFARRHIQPELFEVAG